MRFAIAQQLKLKRNALPQTSDDDADDDEDAGQLIIDEAKEMAAVAAATAAPTTTSAPAGGPVLAADGKIGETADLASVSKLLNNAVAQTFQQYFQNDAADVVGKKASLSLLDAGKVAAAAAAVVATVNTNGSASDEPDDDFSSCDSAGSEYGGAPSDGQPSSSSASLAKKKKSAYSNAPHRVSCPYCSRKFPWTSSLRRHILTHTGQKPYKCPQCPLWFTTKSNCDRHLLRKHGNSSNGGSSAANSNSSGAGNASNVDANGAAINSRNVPDRPFKCALCPSSTFATSDNLKKHVDSKHCPGHTGSNHNGSSGGASSSSHAGSSSGSGSDEETSHKNATSNVADVSADGGDGAELAFKCHLCESGYAERDQVLKHLKFAHSEEFDLLVSKGALNNDDDGDCQASPNADEDDATGEDYEQVRGKFPDYLNRKVNIYSFPLH